MTKRKRLYHKNKQLNKLVKRLNVRWGIPVTINLITYPNE